MKNSVENWHVIYVASRKEKVVYERLLQKGIECFVPLVKRLRIWSDRKKWVEMPLFNGYVFIKQGTYLADQVLQTTGVVAFLNENGAPGIVKNEEIELLKKVIKEGYSVESTLDADQFQEGETVKVIDGPLKGHTGMLLRKNNNNYFVIYFEGIHQGIKIELPLKALVKNEKQP